jgi:hypothetical protein
MKEQQKDSSYLERLAALNLLRENIFYANPDKFTYTDVVEDFPGKLRAVSPVAKNILPSFAIISKDPEIRREQLRQAVEKIKNSKKSTEGLTKEISNNVINMGLGAIVPSFLLSSAIKLLGFRSPLVRNKSKSYSLRSPITPHKVLNKLRNEQGYAKELLSEVGKDSLLGAGLGAASGALYPLIAHSTNVSDKALDEAREIIQAHPYSTSLPGAELVSALKNNPEELSPMKRLLLSGALGLGGGALLGGAHAIAPSAIKALGLGLRSAVTRKPAAKNLSILANKELPKDIATGAAVGAGAGLLGGALANNF